MLEQLARGERCVTDLARPHSMSLPAISKHLIVLERARLISRGRDRQRRPRRLSPKPLAEANAWLERYRELWEANFQRLDALLYEMQAEEKNRRRKNAGKKTAKRSKQ